MSRSVLFLCLLALGILWGSTIPLAKVAVSTGHHPFGLIFWQFLIGVVVLSGIVLWRKSSVVIDGAHLRFFTAIALIGTLIPNTTSFMASFHLPAGVMALIIAMVPIFALLVALLLKIERFQIGRFGGVLLGAIAIALIVLPESSLPDPQKAIFVLLALVAPFCYGVEGNYLALRQPQDTGPIATLFGASLVGTVISGFLVLATDSFINPAKGMGAPEWALVASSLLHVAAYTSYIWMVGAAGSVFASQVGYIVTPAGVLISMAALGERHSGYIWLALAILLVAITLVKPKQAEAPQPIASE